MSFVIEPVNFEVKGGGNIHVRILLEGLAKNEYSSLEDVGLAIKNAGYMRMHGREIYQITPNFLLGKINTKI